MAILTAANSISAVVGAISGCAALFTTAYLYPDAALKRLNSKINIEKLAPKFDVKYYSISTDDPMYFMISSANQENENKLIHPLITSNEIGRSKENGYVVDYFGPNDEEIASGLGVKVDEGQDIDCNYWYFYFKFNGGYDIEDVKLTLDIQNSANDVEENFYFLNADGDFNGNPKNDVVEIGNVNVGEEFKIPISIECSVETIGVNDGNSYRYFTHKKYAFPQQIKYFDPITKAANTFEIRKLLKNTLVDSTGIETRG